MLPIAILAGGLGTRLAPLTTATPKALVVVDGRPFVEHQLELLRAGGFTNIVFCLGHLGEMIEEHVVRYAPSGCKIAYSYDGPQRIGTAGAVAKALPFLGERFFVTYGDSYLPCNYAAVEAAFFRSNLPGLMTVFHGSGEHVPNNVLFCRDRILAYNKETPSPRMRHVDYGVSVFDYAAFQDIDQHRSTDLGAVFQDLIARESLAGYEISSRFHEIGTAEGLAETEAFLRASRHQR